MPHGRDPQTCLPCALIRWRRLLLTYETVADGGAGERCLFLTVHKTG